MESITIYTKNKAQVDLLYQFLQHLDFVVIPDAKPKTVSKRSKHSVFNSAGIWKDRNISQNDLRAEAWKRK
jgi:hypothetical protein